LERSVNVSSTGGKNIRTATVTLTQIPRETINTTVRLDAWNLLKGGPDQRGRLVDTDVGERYGVLPQLCAIELLVFPESKTLQPAGDQLSISEPMPLVIFKWGPREIPVTIESISVQEEVFGDGLFPIQAQVSLSMSVLSVSDVDPSHPAYSRFIDYVAYKEEQAGYLSPAR